MRILIVRLSAIGDVIHGLPVANALRASHPDAHITWLVQRPSHTLLKGHAAVDEVIDVRRGFLKRPGELLALRRTLREAGFTHAIDLQGLSKSAVTGWLSGAPVRLGFAPPEGREISGWFYTERRAVSAEHVVDKNLALAEGLGAVPGKAVFGLVPDPEAVAPYTVNDELITSLPKNYRYSSQFFADELIRMIGPEPDAPFFAYLSFTAPHWPLHAPDAAIAQFAGDYQAGYEQLRVQRLNRLKAEGLVPDNAVQSALPPKVRPWAELSEEERRRESRAMAVYAAMISEIDRHTGRVIDHLAQTGTLDNTLVIFFSDNGAEGHDLDETWSAELFPAIRAVIDRRFDHSTEQMGRPGSYPLYGAGWAHAAAPHLRLYKAFTSEGGTRVTAFMRLPGGQSQPTLEHAMVSVRDVLPTVLDAAGARIPESVAETLAGRSLLPLLRGEQAVDWSGRSLVVEFLGKQAVRWGPWKLVQLPPPYGDGEFALYNLATDLGEGTDVSADHPDVVTDMLARYAAYKARYGVIEPDWVSGY